MARRRRKPTEVNCFHGTAAIFRERIRETGLKPFRLSGGVYFSPDQQRASAYAAMWAVVAHAAGLAPTVEGMVAGFRLPGDAEVHQEQLFDFRVDRPIPPSALALGPTIDCSSLTEAEYAGYLFQSLGVLGWEGDGYSSAELEPVYERVRGKVRELPDHLIAEGIGMIPCF